MALGAAVAALAVAAGAAAYFTSGGSGTATAAAGDVQAVTFAAGTPTGFLYPGTSADVALSITNPNAIPVNVASLVLDTGEGDNGFGVDPGHSDCDLSALSYATQDNGGDGWLVPGTDSVSNVLALDLADAVSMSTAAASECQGATFTVYLAAGS